MKFIQDPAEQTTAITDLILATAALAGVVFLRWEPVYSNVLLKINIWSAAVGLIGLAAALGTAAHGLIISQSAHHRIWRLLNMSLALAVSLFVVGVIYDLWGSAACLKALPIMLLIGIGFFAATLRYPDIFFIFIIYEGLALIFALGAYIFLAVQGELNGAGFIAAGILISIIAAGIQTKQSISLTVIWQFDHNGIYHIVQIIGLPVLIYGLRRSML